MPEGPAIYHGVYHYRRPSVAVAAVLFTLVCVPLFGFYVWALLSKPLTSERFFIALFPLGGLGFLGWLGGLMGYYYLTAKAVHLVITSEGVSYGEKHFPWADIGSLRVGNYNGYAQFLLLQKGRLVLRRWLVTDQGLAEGERSHVMSRLQREVAAVHPHLVFN